LGPLVIAERTRVKGRVGTNEPIPVGELTLSDEDDEDGECR